LTFIRRLFSHPRRRLLVGVSVLMLAVAVCAHHGGPMPDMYGMDAATAICLAVLVLGAAIACVISALPLRPRPPWSIASRAVLRVLAPRAAPARAGPIYLALAVIRR